MHQPCYAPVFTARTQEECNSFFQQNAAYLLGLIFFSCLPQVRCALSQLIFRINHCTAGNDDQNIDLLWDPNEWLADHQEVANSVVWESPSPDGFRRPWAQWTAQEKSDLYAAFWRVRLNQQNGIPTAPADAVPSSVGRTEGTYFTPELAWRIFVAHLGQAFATEQALWASWSLTSFTTEQLAMLLDSRSLFEWNPALERYAVSFFSNGAVTPGDPVMAFRFLVRNALIGGTARLTIQNVLGWARDNLRHFLGLYDADNCENHWQYAGYPPIERMINGTVRSSDHVASHFTAGCHGTTGFLRAVLRTINIPVVDDIQCGHSLPYFVSEGLHLSHGDDPYDALVRAPFPVSELFLNELTYTYWFGPSADGCRNVGRGALDFALRHPTSDYLVQARCDDLSAGRVAHEGSAVFALFSNVYSVRDLEAIDLWEQIDAEIARRGGCRGR